MDNSSPASAPAGAVPGPAGPASAPKTPIGGDAATDLPRSGPDDTLVVEGLLNGGFEWIADDTTAPPKCGAYWSGAFSTTPGDPDDAVAEGDGAADGRRWLRLDDEHPRVLQKVVAHPAWSDRVVVHLAWRPSPGDPSSFTGLRVGLVDGPDRTASVDLVPDDAVFVDGWYRVRVPLGARFVEAHGERPVPRLQLVLERVPGAGAVDVDAVSCEVPLPHVTAQELAARILALSRHTFHTWVAPESDGGLGLVDPATGYVTVEVLDVHTGGDRAPKTVQTLHSLHTLVMRWLRACEALGREQDRAALVPVLEAFTRTLLDEHVHPVTHLPRLVKVGKGPMDQQPVTVGAFVEFLVEAAELVDDEELSRRARRAVRRMADTLLAAQRAHDLDPEASPNAWSLDRSTGVLSGRFNNWYGHIPNRMSPLGVIDTPRRFNTAWAIVTARSFWYHLGKSPAAVVAAHAIEPKDGDLEGVERALSLYHRDWDAARYDLENDTDDHYGYLAEDMLWALSHGVPVPRALELVQGATDHRLERTAETIDDTMWIQAVRLGSACAGDSPRAFKGVLDLYELPPSVNPISSGLPLYREALLELAANDFKGRQLTNSQFTESFFQKWEMVCICFKGTYQGDCRERPLEEWDGDVGDIFGGPPLQGINAQTWAYRAATDDERPEILARLATIMDVTERDLRAEHGYLYGLDPDVARQYELPEKYTIGLSSRSVAGLGYVGAWLELLPHLGE